MRIYTHRSYKRGVWQRKPGRVRMSLRRMVDFSKKYPPTKEVGFRART